MSSEGKNCSALNRFFIRILKGYKKYISGGLNSGCIFTPTCSEYAMDALCKYGFLRALALIVYRLLRCNPLNRGGFDPVPDDPGVKKWLY